MEWSTMCCIRVLISCTALVYDKCTVSICIIFCCTNIEYIAIYCSKLKSYILYNTEICNIVVYCTILICNISYCKYISLVKLLSVVKFNRV